MLPALAMAQNPPKHNGPPSGHKPAQHRPAPGKPGAGRPGKPSAGPVRPGKPNAGRPGAGRPGVGRPGRPGPGRGAYRPLPPRGHQFYHRGAYFGRIHGPAFVYPHGWGYRRWGIGVTFPLLFLAPNYYYNDWAALGLQAPPPGYVWVRYGPDLVLVNTTTRVVEDVVYGVFE
jgi:Nickel/cobalt transporter regulator